jgi:hypothetical protein
MVSINHASNYYLLNLFFYNSYVQSARSGGATHAIQLLSRRGTESSAFWAACIAKLIGAESVQTLIDRWLTMVKKRTLENNSAQLS